MKFQLLQIVPQQLDRETIRQLTTAETKWISKSTNLKTKWLKLITYWPTLQSDEAMFAIAREVEELKHPETDFELSNIPCQLTIRWSASVKATCKYKRTTASHASVFMISPEQRNQKPHALPVQCILCTFLKESEICWLTSELVAEMLIRVTKVGGEYNTLASEHLIYT